MEHHSRDVRRPALATLYPLGVSLRSGRSNSRTLSLAPSGWAGPWGRSEKFLTEVGAAIAPRPSPSSANIDLIVALSMAALAAVRGQSESSYDVSGDWIISDEELQRRGSGISMMVGPGVAIY